MSSKQKKHKKTKGSHRLRRRPVQKKPKKKQLRSRHAVHRKKTPPRAEKIAEAEHAFDWDKAFTELDRLGVEVVDTEVASIWEQGKTEPEGPRSKSVSATPESYDLGDIYDDSIQMYLREIGKVSLLKGKEEVELAQRIQKGDVAARKKLTEANLRLVVSIAKKYMGR